MLAESRRQGSKIVAPVTGKVSIRPSVITSPTCFHAIFLRDLKVVVHHVDDLIPRPIAIRHWHGNGAGRHDVGHDFARQRTRRTGNLRRDGDRGRRRDPLRRRAVSAERTAAGNGRNRTAIRKLIVAVA